MKAPTSIGLLVSALLTSGCDSSNGPERTRVIGAIEFHGEPVVVNVPDTASAGATFAVQVLTYGDGCAEKGETRLEIDRSRAVVTPVDLRKEAEVCPAVLQSFEHSAEVRFREAGAAEVVIRGRRVPPGTVTTVRRKVTVR